MSRINKLLADRKELLNPLTRTEVYIAGSLMAWLTGVREVTGESRTDMINCAVTYAAMRQLAHKHSLQMVLLDHEGQANELPVMAKPFVRTIGHDVPVTVNLTRNNTNYLRWLDHERGLTTETAVADGIRILGAVALAPAASKLIIRGTESERLNVHVYRFDLPGAPPLVLED